MVTKFILILTVKSLLAMPYGVAGQSYSKTLRVTTPSFAGEYDDYNACVKAGEKYKSQESPMNEEWRSYNCFPKSSGDK